MFHPSIPALSELLPSELIKKMRADDPKGAEKFINKADELTKNAAPALAVLTARQVPGADETARRVAALFERFGDRYLPEQLGVGGGGLTYTQPDYSVSAGPKRIGFQTGLLGGQFKAEVENPMDVLGKDLSDIRASIRLTWPLSGLTGGNR